MTTLRQRLTAEERATLPRMSGQLSGAAAKTDAGRAGNALAVRPVFVPGNDERGQQQRGEWSAQ